MISDDFVCEQNAVWYLKHVSTSEELTQYLDKQALDSVIDVLIVGCSSKDSNICESCLQVLIFMIIRQKAIEIKHKLLIFDSIMFHTKNQNDKVR